MKHRADHQLHRDAMRTHTAIRSAAHALARGLHPHVLGFLGPWWRAIGVQDDVVFFAGKVEAGWCLFDVFRPPSPRCCCRCLLLLLSLFVVAVIIARSFCGCAWVLCGV